MSTKPFSPGEQYRIEKLRDKTHIRSGELVRYTYIMEEGPIFFTIATTLAQARNERDDWLTRQREPTK